MVRSEEGLSADEREEQRVHRYYCGKQAAATLASLAPLTFTKSPSSPSLPPPALARSYANPLVEEEPVELSDEQKAALLKESKWLMQPINNYNAFFALSMTNRFRLFVHRIAFDRRFDTMILLAILISSLLLAVENPVDGNAPINQRLRYADILFTALFTLEMVMKWIAMGVWPYVKDPWNDLDLIVVTSSIVSLALEVCSATMGTCSIFDPAPCAR